jgi:CubicO group peptidase (beta-lactamase class C family)
LGNLGACQTRFGPYPYCDEMRHSVFSMTKSLGALVSMLRLAHKYGDHVFDLKIKDYVNVSATREDTFADALNMITGDVFRYSDLKTNTLAAAMDRFLKSREGPDANIWNMVLEEVLRPIGVFHAPIVHFSGPDGSRGVPILSGGIFPTYHDIAKIALLIQNGGRYRGEQLLSEGKIREALYRTEIRGAPAPNSHNPRVSYYMSLWQVPTELDKCTINVSMMSGVGGKIAILLPSGAVAFYVRNRRGPNFVRELTVAASSLRSECQ